MIMASSVRQHHARASDRDLAESLRVARSRSRPPIRRRHLNALRLLSAGAAAALIALVYVATRGDEPALSNVASLYASLFLALVAGTAAAAHRGWWGWGFFAAVVAFGPLASLPGLEIQRANADRREKFIAAR